MKRLSAASFFEKVASLIRGSTQAVQSGLDTVVAYKQPFLGSIIIAMSILLLYVLFVALPLRQWIFGFIGYVGRSVYNKIRTIAWSFATSHVGRASLVSAMVSSALAAVIMWLPVWMVPMSIIGMVAVQTCIELLINPSIGLVVLKSAVTISLVQWFVLSLWPYMSNVIYLILGSACIHGFIHDRALLHRHNQQQKLGQKAPDLKAGQKAPDLKAGQKQSEPHKPGQNQNAAKSVDPQQGNSKGNSKVESNHVEVRIRKGFPG